MQATSNVVSAAKHLQGLRRNRIAGYDPYPKQREFHRLGASHRERLLMAANQVGKTLSAGFEVAIHATGLYPDWWEGRRFPGPTKWWFSNTNLETTRDGPQRILFGEDLDLALGTGTLPKDRIEKISKARGIPNAVDEALIRHASGGFSKLSSRAYDQQREKWQSETLTGGVWFDEEPGEDIYSEGLTRMNATSGIAFITATPLLGMTEVVGHFYPEPDTPQRALVQMTDEDALHLTDEQRTINAAAYKPHEREARTKGLPMVGAGLVFPIVEEEVVVDPFPIPGYWKQLIGLDFGYNHPTAAVNMAWDEEHDIQYITAEYRKAEELPVVHAAALKTWGDWKPVVWPHDGHRRFKDEDQSMKTTADQYRALGLKMWHEHATFQDGGYGLEAGIQLMMERFRTGRLKVFSSCRQWIEERRGYHRSSKGEHKGKVVDRKDDLIAASRIASMMARRGGAGRREDDYRRPQVPQQSYDWGLHDSGNPSEYYA